MKNQKCEYLWLMYQVKTPFYTNMHFFYLSADTPVYDFLESCLRHKSEVKVILVVYGKKKNPVFLFFKIIMTLYSLKLFTCRSYIILPVVFLQHSFENRQTDKPDSVIPM